MKTLENKGFVSIRNAMGWNVPVKPPSDSQIVNEINGFEHVSYGMTVMKNAKFKSRMAAAAPHFAFLIFYFELS
jgi:hypothetical protein